MGNFEKLIVLVVLFAAAVVLAINFTGGEPTPADPLAGAKQVLAAEPEVETAGDLSGLLDAGSEAPEAAPETDGEGAWELDPVAPAGLTPATPAPAGLVASEASDPTRPILVDSTGLRPSFLDEYMVYSVREGDTWAGLAQRFYQDGRFTRNLIQANDDPAALEPGMEILVPVHDVIAADTSRAVAEPAPSAEDAPSAAPSFAAAPRSSAPAEVPAAKPKAAAVPAGEYVVQPGDTLSEIALAAFGSSARWKEILEANRERLEKPENLRAGMKLVIPAGGKVPATSVAKADDKKAEPKKAAPAAATPKKKKVL